MLIVLVGLIVGWWYFNKTKDSNVNKNLNSTANLNQAVNKNTNQSQPDQTKKSVITATKISNAQVTDAQIDFINNNFDYVLTSILDERVRNKIQDPTLFLYRSMQDGWPDFNQFDWDHMDAHENMFYHNNGERIWTIYNSYLMNHADLVDKDDPDTLNHWVNYFAVTASQQVNDYGYDGLFIDCANHKLWRGTVKNIMPDNYDDQTWKNDRIKALQFIKSYFPDKPVTYNGLHSENGAEESLEFTNGGMWEVFAYSTTTGEYEGQDEWQKVIDIAEEHKGDKLISIVTKKKGIIADIETRIFLWASYLLVSHENVVFNMNDLDYDPSGMLLYYPEYDIYLGGSLGSYTINNGVYVREFEDGLFLVNPDENNSYSYSLDREYNKVIPQGGGLIPEDGDWQGSLNYEIISGEVNLPAVSGMVLINK